MHEILLSPQATDEFRKLTPSERNRAMNLMQRIQRRASALKRRRVYSALLDTTLYLVQSAGLRLLFEINDSRAVILTVNPRS